MKQAIKVINEINRKREAIRNTKSTPLINDYSKSIKSDMLELKEYCRYKGIDFNKLTEGII